MKILFNNGVFIVSIFPTGEVRVGKINGNLYGIRPGDRLYAACVTERQPDTVRMLYETLKDEHESTTHS